MKERFFRVVKILAVILAAGLVYAGFVAATGLAVPCMFHSITGLWCPGCGMTRMCLALLKGDIRGAFYSNAGVFLAMPALAVCLGSSLIRFVKTGNRQMTRFQNVILVLVILWLAGFGIIRNLI